MRPQVLLHFVAQNEDHGPAISARIHSGTGRYQAILLSIILCWCTQFESLGSFIGTSFSQHIWLSIHTYTYMYTYSCTYMYIHTYIHTYIYTAVLGTSTSTYSCTYIHVLYVHVTESHDKDTTLTGLATTLLSCLFSYNTSAKCIHTTFSTNLVP